jgi:hypothetical protein
MNETAESSLKNSLYLPHYRPVLAGTVPHDTSLSVPVLSDFVKGAGSQEEFHIFKNKYKDFLLAFVKTLTNSEIWSESRIVISVSAPPLSLFDFF